MSLFSGCAYCLGSMSLFSGCAYCLLFSPPHSHTNFSSNILPPYAWFHFFLLQHQSHSPAPISHNTRNSFPLHHSCESHAPYHTNVSSPLASLFPIQGRGCRRVGGGGVGLGYRSMFGLYGLLAPYMSLTGPHTSCGLPGLLVSYALSWFLAS